MWHAACFAWLMLPPWATAALSGRSCGTCGSRRKGSETFDDETTFIPGNAALGNTNFEEDRLWQWLRPIPGLILWAGIVACFVLPLSAPAVCAYITIFCMVQNILQMLFSMWYTFRGFRRMERSMTDPVALPPMPLAAMQAVGAAGKLAAVAGSSGEGVPPPGGAASSPSAAAAAASAAAAAAAGSSVAPGASEGTIIPILPDKVDLGSPPPHPAEVVHMVAICRCTEPVEVLQETIDHLACHSNRKQYIILLCLEAKDKAAASVGEGLIARYTGFFARVMYAIHPARPEEVPGKSANVNYAVRVAHAALEAEWGARAADRIVVTVADCDAKISEHYFNELSVRFAAAAREKREAFWAPPSLFDLESAEAAAAAAAAAEPSKVDPLETLVGSSGAAVVRNLLGSVVPAPVKIADQMWSMFVLQNLSGSNWVRLPCSTYSVGLRLIASVGYWDTGVESVPEDYHTALKIYWGTGGRARLEPIYHPVLYQHIDGGSWLGTCLERFQQGIRHMWGATDFAYIMWLSVRVPTVPAPIALRLILTVLDVHVAVCSIAFFSSFAMPMLSLLRPGWLATGYGPALVTTQTYAALFLLFVTLLTGAVYEWYSSEMVAACKRREGILGATPGADPPRPPSPTADAAGPPQLIMGQLERRNRSLLATLPRVTGASAFDYFLKMLPWLWMPICALLYMLWPAAVAQTKLICANRMRKVHVSGKVATPAPTPRPSGGGGGPAGSPLSAASSAAGGSSSSNPASVFFSPALPSGGSAQSLTGSGSSSALDLAPAPIRLQLPAGIASAGSGPFSRGSGAALSSRAASLPDLDGRDSRV